MIGRVVALGDLRGKQAAALVIDGQLHDLLIDEDDGVAVGAIFRARVDRQMKGQGGVFLRLPGGESGFLRDAGGLKPGRSLLVQVTGHAEAGKAIPVTQRLLFKGRTVIVTPGAPGMNVSRAIRDPDIRAGLEALARSGMEGRPENLGLILRSAAADADSETIGEELSTLASLAQAILSDTDGDPELLLDAPPAHEIAWRDWSDPAPDEVADGPTAFADLGIEEMVDALLSPEVRLGQGGMAIEPTRALVAVDVNTGGDTTPAAGLKINIAAARDLPRQLRLRGLGGQVVVDFAPMPKKDRHILEQVLRTAFKGEGAETSLVGWTTLGLYELQRKRDRRPLAEVLK
ncbi:MAG: ribonuclease E/G [Paracoccaceae bacterium]